MIPFQLYASSALGVYIQQTFSSSLYMKDHVIIITSTVMMMRYSLSTRTLLLLQFSYIHDVEIEDGWRMKIDLFWFLFFSPSTLFWVCI